MTGLLGPGGLLVLLGSAMAGALIGVPARRWLDSGSHRYEDEAELRQRRHGWVAPVATLSAGLAGWAQSSRPAYAAVVALAVAALVVLVAIDIDVRRLPDRFTKPAWVVVPLALGVAALLEGSPASFVSAVVGGLLTGAFYLVVVVVGALLNNSGMGMGDLKLSPSLGALVGYLGWQLSAVAVFATFLVGGLWAVALVLTGRAGRGSAIAFGPMMAIGTWFVLVLPLLALPILLGGA